MNEQTKTFDCVEMKRQIQEQIYEDTRGMTPDQVLAYFRTRIAQSQFAAFLNVPETAPAQSDTSKVSHDL